MTALFTKRLSGLVRYYGLTEWWLTAFNEEERERIVSLFQPLGGSGNRLIEGDISFSSGSAVSLLSGMAGWFRKEPHRFIAYKILDKAETPINAAPVLDRHFFYQAKIEGYYRFRDFDDFALGRAIIACEQQIALSADAAHAFRGEFPGQQLPRHVGFEQLAIIREKQKNFREAIDLCERAAEERWGGTWERRVVRLRKRLAKA